MAARALAPPSPLGSMWGPPRAPAGSPVTEASAAAAHAARRGGAAVSPALSGLRGRYRTFLASPKLCIICLLFLRVPRMQSLFLFFFKKKLSCGDQINGIRELYAHLFPPARYSIGKSSFCRHSLCSVQFMDGLGSNIQAEVNLALSPKASMSNGNGKFLTFNCISLC